LKERHTHALFLLLLLAQLVLVTSHSTDEATGSSVLEEAAVRGVEPVARAVTGTFDSVRRSGEKIATRRSLQEQNTRLREEVEHLRAEVTRLYSVDAEIGQLSEALNYARSNTRDLRVADIVYIDHASWLQTLVLHVGENEAKLNQPVVSRDGLIGRIVVASGPSVKVQLITDRAASVGAMIERTRRQGIVRGGGKGALKLDFVSLQADVRVGDRVVTAGIDGIYPRGVPVGIVTSVEPGSELFHNIRLAPAVDFAEITQVYILETEPLSAETKAAAPEAGTESGS